MDEAAQKIKVFEINTSFAYAGAQRTMFSFCKYLRKDYFQIFAISYGEGGSRQKDFESLGIPTLVAAGDLEKIFALAEKEQPAVIHIHRSGGPNQLERELLQKLRVMLPQAAIVETNVFGQYDSVTGSVIDMHLLKSKMMLNERFISATGGGYNPKKMHVVYNPVDCASFENYRLTPEQIEEYKRFLKIPKNNLVIGRLGRPDITKWSDLLLEMLPILFKQNPEITCLIQDVPSSRKNWVRKMWSEDKVVLIPETANEAEVHRFYQTIDILTHTSKIGEAFGNTINEAMYWKKPVITHSTPNKDNGQIEQVDHGKNGYIANTPEQMAGAVIFLGKNKSKREEMGTAGNKKVREVYDPEKVTRQVEKAFVEILDSKGHSILQEPQLVKLPAVYVLTPWSPSEEDIRNYKEMYSSRLLDTFYKSDIPQSTFFQLIHRTARRLAWKVHDFAKVRSVPFFGSDRMAHFLVWVFEKQSSKKSI